MKPIEQLISLEGRRAVITGAASGIGRATAIRLAEAGSSLHLVDINPEGLEKTRQLASRWKVDIQMHIVDLSRRREIDNLWRILSKKKPDILINNAGVYEFRDFLQVDPSFYRKNMAINLDAVFWMSQHFIRSLEDGAGTIVNVSSIEAFLPFARGLAHYDTAKLGIVALTRAIAREFGSRIRANVVVPGGIETEGVKRLKKETLTRMDLKKLGISFNFNSRLPAGRFGNPDEVARVILFLVSELASYINGAIIPVDGGFLSS